MNTNVLQYSVMFPSALSTLHVGLSYAHTKQCLLAIVEQFPAKINLAEQFKVDRGTLTGSNWRASVASETLTGVTQSKIGDVYKFICIYVWTYVCHFVL